MSRRPSRAVLGTRAGFTIVEIIVAMVLLGIVVTTIAGANVAILRRNAGVSRSSVSALTLVRDANRLSVLPYDSLSSRAGCTSVPAQPNPYTRCITVSTSGSTKTVTIVLTPTSSIYRPDTVVIRRTKPITSTPFDQ